MNRKAVIVFSGGQDSTTCLLHALPRFEDIHCITFNYGQRHRAEIEVSLALSRQLGITSHTVLDASLLNALTVSSLTRSDIAVAHADQLEENGLPNTFVPGRNILFLTLASIYAYQVQARPLSQACVKRIFLATRTAGMNSSNRSTMRSNQAWRTTCRLRHR